MSETGDTVRVCGQCGQKNRIPVARLAQAGRCGSCDEALPPASQPIDVDPESFKAIVNSADVPVLVDFWAAWCGPCRMAAPHVKKAANNLAGEALVLKVDTEQHPQLAQMFQVRGIPTFAVLKGGELIRQQAGFVNHHQMEAWLKQAS